MARVSYKRDDLGLDDKSLLRRCEVHIYKSSGPGGQHRNKVSSAVRLRHRPTGITAHGDERRSQHENTRAAVRRLRMNIACKLRLPVDKNQARLPQIIAEHLVRPHKLADTVSKRLEISRSNHRFWEVAAFLLDVLAMFDGRLGEAAKYIGITTGNLTGILKKDRHLFGATQALRRRFHQKPLK